MKKSLKDVYKNLLKESKKRKIKSNSNQLLEQELELQQLDLSKEPSPGELADFYSSLDSKKLEDYFTEDKFDKMCEEELQKITVFLDLVLLEGDENYPIYTNVHPMIGPDSFLAFLLYAKDNEDGIKSDIEERLKEIEINLERSLEENKKISRFKSVMLEDADPKAPDENSELIQQVMAKAGGKPNQQREKGSGLGRIKEIVNANNLDSLKTNIFRFLYDKFCNRITWENKEKITGLAKKSLDDIIDLFKELIESRQALLTVNYGAFFEEYFNNYVYQSINNNKPDYKYNFEHSTKKLAIILTLIISKKFKSGSSIYQKVISNSSSVSNNDFINE